MGCNLANVEARERCVFTYEKNHCVFISHEGALQDTRKRIQDGKRIRPRKGRISAKLIVLFLEKLCRAFRENVAFAVMQNALLADILTRHYRRFSAMTSFISFVDDFEIVLPILYHVVCIMLFALPQLRL